VPATSPIVVVTMIRITSAMLTNISVRNSRPNESLVAGRA